MEKQFLDKVEVTLLLRLSGSPKASLSSAYLSLILTLKVYGN